MRAVQRLVGGLAELPLAEAQPHGHWSRAPQEGVGPVGAAEVVGAGVSTTEARNYGGGRPNYGQGGRGVPAVDDHRALHSVAPNALMHVSVHARPWRKLGVAD